MEFLVNAPDVTVQRTVADPEIIDDFLVTIALGELIQNVSLAGSQLLQFGSRLIDLRIKCGFGNEVDRVEKIMIALKIFYGVVKNRGFLGFYYRSKHIVSVYLDLSWESSKIFLLSK